MGKYIGADRAVLTFTGRPHPPPQLIYVCLFDVRLFVHLCDDRNRRLLIRR